MQGRLDGKSKKQAALDAGFSETKADHVADKIETRDVREAFARLVREMVPPEFIAKTIADGMAATETKFFSHEGLVQDQRDVPAWSERRQYAEIAAEYGGYHAPTSSEQIVPSRLEPGTNGRVIHLGWAQTDLQDWRASVFEAFFQQNNDQSGIAR